MVYKWLYNNLLRWLPQPCVLCGGDSQLPAICQHCLDDLPRLLDPCQRCGLPLGPGDPQRICGQCLRQPPSFDRVVGALAYARPVAELITGLKFHNRIALARILGEVLAIRVRSVGHGVEGIVPVPLHPRRVRERGFNQALEIARPLARLLDLPIHPGLVYRKRYTAAQSTRSPPQRAFNMRGAFALRDVSPPGRVALVDDVMTSGHTVNELANLLQAAGVEYIEVWCVARAVPHRP